MVNSTQTISQSVCRLFTSVLSNLEFIAISRPYTPVSLSFTIWGYVPSVHSISIGREVFGR